MSHLPDRITIVTWLESSINQVWWSVVHPDGSNTYLTDRTETTGAREKLVAGDQLTLYYGDIINRARVLELVPMEQFTLSDSYESMNPDGSVQPFQVKTSYTFTQEGKFVKLTLEVSGFSIDEFGQWFRECMEMGWKRSLVNLKSVLELGMDLRTELFSYPRLGVNNCTVNKDHSLKTGVGIKEGNYLLTVFPNSPADKAGLRDGDVIVSLAGKPVPTYADFVKVISTWYGKDEPIPLVYVRSGEQREKRVSLSLDSAFTGIIDSELTTLEREREQRKRLAAQRSAAGTMWKES